MAKDNMIAFPLVDTDSGVIVDVECECEIRKIVNKGSHQARFVAAYEERIRVLKQYRDKAPSFNPRWFEKLQHIQNASLYSINFAKIGNMRILYTVSTRIILLCAFEEREGHGKKRQSYVQYVPVALKRLEKYEEDHNGT